ncbi:MAG: DUF1549 and DUF1553 domain-containing protein [Planctomycetales bacterium]|nr:DUF1549 and DUF1553 domain-containing protein [Planctomycetales bacterium]
MWARNFLFVVLCLAGLVMIGSSLLDRNRIDTPHTFVGGQARLVSTSLPAEIKPVSEEWPLTTARVNSEFEKHWQAQGLSHAGKASEFAIVRRLSLALTGTIPSVEEVRALEQVNPENRIEWWVAHLLEDRRYADYFAERLARAYVGTEDGPFILYRRRRFVTWLADHLHRNDRYDKIVTELISDTGLWNASPAVNFVTVTAQQNKGNKPDEIRLAGRTTRAFLGMRIDCLQCHDDKLAKVTILEDGKSRGGTQQDFHHLAAFFGETKMQLTGVRDDSKLEYKYKYLHADNEEVVPPKVPYGQEIFDGKGTRREQLARWVTNPKNKPFARATVNRIWALMFGKPLVNPVDDIPLEGPFPPAMDTLADDFIAHGYDLKRLIRIIAASEVYQLDSGAEFEITPAHEEQWAVYPVTRLRPEQVAGSVIQSSSLPTINAQAHLFSQLGKFISTAQFVQRYGDLGEDEFIDRGGTIPQRLLMMNGELVKERSDNNPVQNASTRISMVTLDNEKAVETAYLATLTRRPSPEELAHFITRLNERFPEKDPSSRSQKMEDIYWVLLNSTEFSWNH